ncbi:MAG: asparagine synthase (glutamine-hydrolyzing) [Burkholderiaceae bacterium]|nr:MAG: asparagine synthase (glutamine-hydrolyzing) [Burkholderiaceae bacterium]
MCGLIGAVAVQGLPIESRIDAGLCSLRHRGPDHQEMQNFPLGGREVWLGHARLSVIDLNDAANQPMASQDDRYVLIFNGEIYNYIELRDDLRKLGVVFRTNSDTEVLLHAWAHWGEACLEKLDGMFAFALLDKAAGTLTCARDPFGIKPLFYASQDGGFFFASELPAMLALLPVRPGPDLQRAYDYLVHGDYDSSERTFVDGVRHLMPGHVLTLDVTTSNISALRQWWTPNVEQTSTLSFDDAAEAVRAEFLQNVHRQLRSDVPLGAALSGGIDSSAVVCAIRHLEPDLPIHTFSYIASDAAISEDRWVDLVNQQVDAQPHKVFANADDLARDIDTVVCAQGEPFGSTSIYAQRRVFQLARESGITVTLDGQGADELLAGYAGYPGQRAMSLVQSGHVMEAARFLMRWSRWHSASGKQTAAALARALLPDGAYDALYRLDGRGAEPAWLNAGVLLDAGVRFVRPKSLRAPGARGRRLIEFLGRSLQHQGLPSLLRHGDRNSMAFAIESRVPFLTPQLCRLLYALPENYLISDAGQTKHVFRAAMRGIVPDAILDRRDKIGFATPERNWFIQLAPQYRGWLKAARTIPFLNHAQLIGAFDAIVSGKRRFDWQVWRWVNYARWWTGVLSIDVEPQCTKTAPVVSPLAEVAN